MVLMYINIKKVKFKTDQRDNKQNKNDCIMMKDISFETHWSWNKSWRLAEKKDEDVDNKKRTNKKEWVLGLRKKTA